MTTATYYKFINGEEQAEVATDAFLDAGLANLRNYDRDVAAMRVAAADKFAFVEFEIRYGFAPRMGEVIAYGPGTRS